MPEPLSRTCITTSDASTRLETSTWPCGVAAVACAPGPTSRRLRRDFSEFLRDWRRSPTKEEGDHICEVYLRHRLFAPSRKESTDQDRRIISGSYSRGKVQGLLKLLPPVACRKTSRFELRVARRRIDALGQAAGIDLVNQGHSFPKFQRRQGLPDFPLNQSIPHCIKVTVTAVNGRAGQAARS